MRVFLSALLLALNANLLMAQSNSSTGIFNQSSSTGPFVNQSSSTGQFNQSSTGAVFNQSSSTGIFNQSSTGSWVNQSSSSTGIFNQSSSTGLFNESSTGIFESSSTGLANGCFNCLPLVTCAFFDEWNGPGRWPTLSLHSSGNIHYDNDACNIVYQDINYVNSVLPGADEACADRVLNFTCTYSQYREKNGVCDQAMNQQYQSDCLNALSCLDAAGQAQIANMSFCTDFNSFLNRPIVLPESSSSSSSTGAVDEDELNSAVSTGASMMAVLISSVIAVMTL